MLQLVADVDHHVGIFREVERGEPGGRRAADPQRVRLREAGEDLPRLRHRHAEQLGELHRLRHGPGVVHLVADDHERHPRLGEQLRRALELRRIGPHAHARIDFLLRDDFGANALVVEVRMPRRVGRAIGRRPGRLERAAHGLWDHVRAAREPGVLGERRDQLLLVGDLLEAVAPGAAGLVGAIAVEDERRLLLEGVEHLTHGVREAHHRRLHDDSRLAGGLHVARGHGRTRTLVRREDVLELRPVDERLVEMRVLARRVAEDVFDARGDELLGEALGAGPLDELDSIRTLCVSRGHERFEH